VHPIGDRPSSTSKLKPLTLVTKRPTGRFKLPPLTTTPLRQPTDQNNNAESGVFAFFLTEPYDMGTPTAQVIQGRLRTAYLWMPGPPRPIQTTSFCPYDVTAQAVEGHLKSTHATPRRESSTLEVSYDPNSMTD
jgi:hypothetical protein